MGIIKENDSESRTKIFKNGVLMTQGILDENSTKGLQVLEMDNNKQ
jgi:hypothetical protein